MSKQVTKGGYYTRDGKDYRAIDPAKLSDTGELLTKDSDAGNWSDATAYRSIEAGSPLYIIPTDDFLAKFRECTAEEALGRQRDREAEESRKLAAEQGDPAAGELEA